MVVIACSWFCRTTSGSCPTKRGNWHSDGQSTGSAELKAYAAPVTTYRRTECLAGRRSGSRPCSPVATTHPLAPYARVWAGRPHQADQVHVAQAIAFGAHSAARRANPHHFADALGPKWANRFTLAHGNRSGTSDGVEQCVSVRLVRCFDPVDADGRLVECRLPNPAPLPQSTLT